MKRAFVILALFSATWEVSFAQPAHIIIIRHAEKPLDRADKHLSVLGEQRAARLVKFFKENAELSQFRPIAALFATGLDESGKGQRCQQTLKPLSASLGLDIRTQFKAEENADLAKKILSDEKLKGKTILICWTKERIPELMTALGVREIPPKLQEDQYDFVYLLSREPGRVNLRIVHQDLELSSAEPEKH